MRWCTIRSGTVGLCLLGAASAASVQAADFNLIGGPIPDNTPAGANFNFTVSGITDPVGQVSISLNLTHTFVGDLQATLISPNGTARLVLFSRLGNRRSGNSGNSANLSGSYIFDDTATTDLWQTAAGLGTTQIVPTGVFRTSTAGTPLSDHGGCTTRLNLAFGGLTPAQTNGTWTLNIADVAGGDTGTLNLALLSINPPTQTFASGFEDASPTPAVSNLRGSCTRAFHDYTGTGLTSYTVVRNTGGGNGGAITWFVKNNDGTDTGTVFSFGHGVSTDIFVDGDYDGDGISDAAVYRPDLDAYLVRRSSRPNDGLLTIPMVAGVTSENPKNVGDFDGDNVTDGVVYVPGAIAGQLSRTLIRLSRTGTLRELITGENGAFHSGGVDFSGDGLADVVMQSNGGSNQGRFRLCNGVSGAIFGDFNFGTPVDLVVTGNHSGNALADITTVRGVNTQLNWSTRDTGTGTAQPTVILGDASTDFLQAGDFDGDGLSDIALWRGSATAGQSKFIVRRSSAPAATPVEVAIGIQGDYPVPNSRTN